MAASNRSAIVTAAVMVAGSLAWVIGIDLADMEGKPGFFGLGPLIADANLILEVFLVAGLTYGFLLARRGNIDAHQVNQTTWVVLNIGLIALVMAGSMQDVKISGAGDLADWRVGVTWLHAGVGTLTALAGLWIGNRLQGRLTRAALLRFVSALLFLIGLSLLVRALTGG